MPEGNRQQAWHLVHRSDERKSAAELHYSFIGKIPYGKVPREKATCHAQTKTVYKIKVPLKGRTLSRRNTRSLH